MAKYKEAADAASRRLEMAMAHIDRLTDELVDAKMRARQHEASTRKVPVLQAEVARLQRQVEDGTSDALAEMEGFRDWERTRADAALDYAEGVRKKWFKVTERFAEAFAEGRFQGKASVTALINLLDDHPEWWDTENQIRYDDVLHRAGRKLTGDAQLRIIRKRAMHHKAMQWGRGHGA